MLGGYPELPKNCKNVTKMMGKDASILAHHFCSGMSGMWGKATVHDILLIPVPIPSI
jgi:hypothetical protein